LGSVIKRFPFRQNLRAERWGRLLQPHQVNRQQRLHLFHQQSQLKPLAPRGVWGLNGEINVCAGRSISPRP
jgi:hypothetical protein